MRALPSRSVPGRRVTLAVVGALLFLSHSPALAAGAAAGPVTPQLGAGGLIAVSGVANEREYRETILLSGSPRTVTGTRTLTRSAGRDGSVTVRVAVRAQSADGAVKLNRSLNVSYRPAADGGSQRVFTVGVDRFSETIDVGADQFRLEDYRLSGSVLLDERPAVRYASGNWAERRTYSINRDAGQVVVQVDGEVAGYDNPWGKAEVAAARVWLESRRRPATGAEQRWTGTARLNASAAWSQSVSYVTADPDPIPFAGGLSVAEHEEGRIELRYDLPAFTAAGDVDPARRNTGTAEDRIETAPALRRLPLGYFRDLDGHWAEAAIRELQGWDAFDREGSFFGPDLPMLRGDFARAAAVAAGLAPPAPVEPAPARSARPGGGTPSASAFADVSPGDPNLPYIEAVRRSGLMNGPGFGLFEPDGVVNRAQAVTILVRAVGLQARAPTPGYRTEFRDDAVIPPWAKDAVYAAVNYGIVEGDGSGDFRPDAALTRAEAAALVRRLIRFLRDDLRRAYLTRPLDLR